MSFVKQNVDKAPAESIAFAIAKKTREAKAAIGAEQVVDATVGSLYNEERNVVALDNVSTPYSEIVKEIKAIYAVSFVGSDSSRKQAYEWAVGGTDSAPAHSVIVIPGGTGAVAIIIQEILDEGEAVILPEVAWGSYRLMTTMDNLRAKTYSPFEGDHFNIESLKETYREVMKTQKKLLLVINNPCHNLAGYSMSTKEWQEIVVFLNGCGEEVPVALLNDIAYIDLSYDLEHCRNYIKTFNDFSGNVMAVIAFSCNKTLIFYGLHCSTATLLTQAKEAVRDVEIVLEKVARTIWNNAPSAIMENFTYVTTTNYDTYMEEKAMYMELLEKKGGIFTEEADACRLDYYPYKEGFFVAVRIGDNALRDVFHEGLVKQHTYTVKVNKGVYVAVRSLSSEKCRRFTERMREILDTYKQTHITLA